MVIYKVLFMLFPLVQEIIMKIHDMFVILQEM